MCIRLTIHERKLIKRFRDIYKLSRRKIWEKLWRDHSILYKEYKRNKKRWWHYDPQYAQIRTKQRTYYKKKQTNKIRKNTILENYILDKLQEWRSAETVSWRRNNHDRYIYNENIIISWWSIRKYIDWKYGDYIKYTLLQEKKLQKYKKKAKHWKREWWNIKHRTFIYDRPLTISNPTEYWHFEVDFIESVKWDTAVILVLKDKLTRLSIARKLCNKKSLLVYEELKELIPIHWIKTMTFDNDNWFALHYKLWIPTYFCNTYSSWQKWQVERWNVYYRKFFTKKTELKNISQDDLDIATNYINTLPMKCLNYLSPYEYINKLDIKINNKDYGIVEKSKINL